MTLTGIELGQRKELYNPIILNRQLNEALGELLRVHQQKVLWYPHRAEYG